MLKPLGGWLLLVGLSVPLAEIEAQAVHEVRMEAGVDGEEYRFVPSQVTARPGDVLLFRVASGGPHSVVFDARKVPPSARAALNAAMPDRFSDLSGPTLTGKASYRIVLPLDLPPGRYPFYCLPHRAYDMAGEVQVTAR